MRHGFRHAAFLFTLLQTALYVMSMEKLVRLMAVGLAKELSVDLLNDGVLVRLAEVEITVRCVENVSAKLLQVNEVAH